MIACCSSPNWSLFPRFIRQNPPLPTKKKTWVSWVQVWVSSRSQMRRNVSIWRSYGSIHCASKSPSSSPRVEFHRAISSSFLHRAFETFTTIIHRLAVFFVIIIPGEATLKRGWRLPSAFILNASHPKVQVRIRSVRQYLIISMPQHLFTRIGTRSEVESFFFFFRFQSIEVLPTLEWRLRKTVVMCKSCSS